MIYCPVTKLRAAHQHWNNALTMALVIVENLMKYWGKSWRLIAPRFYGLFKNTPTYTVDTHEIIITMFYTAPTQLNSKLLYLLNIESEKTKKLNRKEPSYVYKKKHKGRTKYFTYINYIHRIQLIYKIILKWRVYKCTFQVRFKIMWCFYNKRERNNLKTDFLITLKSYKSIVVPCQIRRRTYKK